MSGKSKKVEPAGRVYFPLLDLSRKIERDCSLGTTLKVPGIQVVPKDNQALLVKEMSEIMGVNVDAIDISITRHLPLNKESEKSTNC